MTTLKFNDEQTKRSNEFFAFATERYNIMLNKNAGKPAPWTEDDILQNFYFCNVFREDDAVTKWFRENIREPLRNDPVKVWVAIAAFRSFNRVEPTGIAMKDMLLKGKWDPDKAKALIHNLPKPVITGAYMVPSQTGKNKIDHLVDTVDNIAKDAEALMSRVENGKTSLAGLWNVVCRYPGIGPFVAYEFITDLRQTDVMDKAPDIMTWASPGPGAFRGASWIMADNDHHFQYPSKATAVQINEIMQLLLARSQTDTTCWPSEFPKMEMRDIEHTLCEFSKWKTGKSGGRMKRSYNATGLSSGSRNRSTAAMKTTSPGASGAGTII